MFTLGSQSQWSWQNTECCVNFTWSEIPLLFYQWSLYYEMLYSYSPEFFSPFTLSVLFDPKMHAICCQQCISDSSCLRGWLPICLDGIHCSLDDLWPSNTSWCRKLLIYRCLQFVEINISVCLPVHGHLVTSSIIAAAMWEFRSVMLRVAFCGVLIVLTFTFHHQLLLKLRETKIFHVIMTCADEVVPICPHWSFYVSSCLT